jgi:hypothetical protein
MIDVVRMIKRYPDGTKEGDAYVIARRQSLQTFDAVLPVRSWRPDGVSSRWCAALLMASPSVAAEEAPALSACFNAIQNRPTVSAMTIAASTHCRILNLQVMVYPLGHGGGH